MNYQWKHFQPTDEQAKRAEHLAGMLNLHPVIGTLLVERGVETVEEAKQFFRPQLTQLHDPFLFKDMKAAINRLNEALGRKERILVYGDYDVDGVTAVALVYKFLHQYCTNIDYYIPDRYEDGYGVSHKGVDYAHETGVKLIIVLDCGIKAVEEIAYAKSLGIDFIICDHHVPDKQLPPAAAVLNAKRVDHTYPYEHLCGCGVGFKLIQAFAASNGIPFSDLIPLLDLCAISIASDIVPILGENRILAYHGLRQINQSPSVGVKAIIDVCGLSDKEIMLTDIIFKIGPRINASGRIQNGKESVALLIEKDPEKAREMAEVINHYNEQRKDVASIDERHEHKGIVIYNEEWHKGIIGIVASRLTEIYNRPSVVLTRDNDLATGSARSVAGFDIYKAIESCEDLLENFGGHTYASGLTLKAVNVPEFKRRFEEYVDEHILPEQTQPQLDVDAMLDFKDISRRLFNELRRFEPFGPNNAKPVFCTRRVYDYGTSKVVGRNQEHIKLELVDNRSNNVMSGIAFGQSALARYIKTKRAFDIVYTVEENTHKHGEIQLQIEDISLMDE